MSLDLLDAPLRLTWAIAGNRSPLNTAQLSTIAGRIADAGLFFVTLDNAPLLNPAWRCLVECLVDQGCQVRLVCQGSDDELEQLTALAERSVELLFDVARLVNGQNGLLDLAVLTSTLEKMRTIGFDPALSLTPLRHHLPAIPKLLRFCQDHKVRRLRLPNATIVGSFAGYGPGDLPNWPDLQNFSQHWAEQTWEGGDWPILEIHDLFLWEILTPGDLKSRAEYGGCQAGNSLAHVDDDGQLHPCSAWPHLLGSLLTSSLEELWQGTERFAVRRLVEQAPQGCVGCRDLALCQGGCRGLGITLNRECGERDLMCRGPR
ncbi:MAG: hypothetical protein C0614_02510 [Desulfuromonas sp.]|nr:MAG: hypothetical protein C0614_02510 [Desulfuromonas sp.]